MNKNASAFKSKLRTFWQSKELCFLATSISFAVMLCALMLAIAGGCRFFWLFHAPLHAPWGIVWLCRGSAALWVVFLFSVLIMRTLCVGKMSQKENKGINFGNHHGDGGRVDGVTDK